MISRRLFVTQLGRGAMAVMAFGACSGSEPQATATTTTSPAQTSTTRPPTETTLAADASTTTAPSDPEPVAWHRVMLGNVSAFVLSRRGEAAVVDTGNPSSADDIEGSLHEIGLGWGDVGHVILTHRHGDHVGSLDDVMQRAADATGYAGAADLAAMASPRPLTPVEDGDTVFGLEIVATPGHTPGHISVLDPIGGLLVAGDALNGSDDGGVAGPNPRFSADMATAIESVRKLAQRDFDIVVFGHGDPVVDGAAGLVAELADRL